MTETDSSFIGHDPLGSGRAKTVVRGKGVLFLCCCFSLLHRVFPFDSRVVVMIKAK